MTVPRPKARMRQERPAVNYVTCTFRQRPADKPATQRRAQASTATTAAHVNTISCTIQQKLAYQYSPTPPGASRRVPTVPGTRKVERKMELS